MVNVFIRTGVSRLLRNIKNPNSPFYKFKHLPVRKRVQSLNSIFSFHTCVEKKNHVAIDFYDGSIMYNFNTNETKICDIDYILKNHT